MDTSNDTTKLCTKCGIDKPLTEYQLLTTRKPNGKTYTFYRGTCNQCLAVARNTWRREQAKSRTHKPVALKRCPVCKIEKSANAFGKANREADGLQGRCKACRKAYANANKQQEVARVLKWQRENPERHYAKQRRYDTQHPEKIRMIGRINVAIRRARLSEAGGSFTQQEWEALCLSCNYRCLACGKYKKLTADHVIPVCKGGSSNIDNIQPLCQSCNSRKGVQIIDYRP